MKELNLSLSTRSRKIGQMNRFVFSTLIMALFALAACDDGVKRDYYDNGKLKSELRYADGRLNGESVWYATDGGVMTRAFYRNDTLEGRYQRFHRNGAIEVECWYKHGLRDSVYRSYSDAGVLQLEEYYKEGKLDGEMKKWFDNGQLFQEGHYEDGMMDGQWFVFYPSGALASKAEYQKGRGKQIGYDETGYKCLEVTYADNKKHGKETYFNSNGTVFKTVEYEYGKIVEKCDDTEK